MEDETGEHRRGVNKGDRKAAKNAGSLTARDWFRLAVELDEQVRMEAGLPSNSMGLRSLASLSRYVE